MFILNVSSFFLFRKCFLAHLSRRLKWAFLIACRPSSVCPYTFRILIFFSRANGPISTKLGTIILNIFLTDPCKMTWLCWLQEVFILGLTSNSIFSTLIVAKWHDYVGYREVFILALPNFILTRIQTRAIHFRKVEFWFICFCAFMTMKK